MNDIEERVKLLEEAVNIMIQYVTKPDFQYKRPGSEEYEKLTDTLDYLHNKVKEHSEYFDNMIGDGK